MLTKNTELPPSSANARYAFGFSPEASPRGRKPRADYPSAAPTEHLRDVGNSD